MSGLGYRQRTVLRLLRELERPLPLGYLARACDEEKGGCPSGYHNTSNALGALRDRGLVRQHRHGWWEAA